LEAGRAREAESDTSQSTGVGSVIGMGAGVEYSNGVMKKEQLENGSGVTVGGHGSQPGAL